MRKVITINIPKPCHENWNAMTPNEKGRHCAVCEKTVVDFTKTTDERLVKTFEQNGNLCGRFKNSQLNRDIVFNRKERNNYLSYVASSLLALLAIGTQSVKAQGEPQIIQTERVKTPVNVNNKKAVSVLNEKVITGTVSDETNTPLPGVTVIIKGTTIGASTDFDGNFKIRATKGDTLVFNYIGFETQEIIVGANSKYNITLKEDEYELMGEVIIVDDAFSETDYVCSPEELEAQRKQRRLRTKNYFTFYTNQLKERKAARKQKRKDAKNKKK